MTSKRKRAIVVLALGLFLFVMCYCMMQDTDQRRRELRDDLNSGTLLHRQVVADLAPISLGVIERDESRAGATGLVGVVLLFIGGVLFAIGGEEKQTQEATANHPYRKGA
jgi:hypothetical protein